MDTASQTNWDAEFHDRYNLLTAYLIEYDYFIPEKQLKQTIKDQYAEYGNVRKLKIYKKKINGLDVDYFECELTYNDYNYNYQGFIYNGKAGAVELQFGVQAEGAAAYQKMIDTFCKGFSEVH